MVASPAQVKNNLITQFTQIRREVITKLGQFDRKVTDITRDTLTRITKSEKVGQIGAQIVRGIPIACFLMICSAKTVLIALVMFTIIASIERLSRSGEYVFSGITLYSAVNCIASLVRAVASQYVWSNIFTATLYCGIAVGAMYVTRHFDNPKSPMFTLGTPPKPEVLPKTPEALTPRSGGSTLLHLSQNSDLSNSDDDEVVDSDSDSPAVHLFTSAPRVDSPEIED